MASDTLAYELVRDLLPEDWFELLDCLRSPKGEYQGVQTRWAKFSSMGNGFTFQLESLIFYALASSVAKHLGYERRDVAVYGDDIIIPAGMALRLVDVLAYSGFHVNTSKSYFFGPFRESCGSDWYEGRYVRPFFLKRKMQNAKDYVFVINSLGKEDHLFDPASGDSHMFSNTCGYLLAGLPRVVADNLLGPITKDLEGHLHATLDYASKSKFVRWDGKRQTWSYASVKASPRYYLGEAGPLYLQLMGHDSFGRDDSTDVLSLISETIDSSYLALMRGLSVRGIRKSSVVRRRDIKSRLATQTSMGWRND